jgi:hypothetical protein
MKKIVKQKNQFYLPITSIHWLFLQIAMFLERYIISFADNQKVMNINFRNLFSDQSVVSFNCEDI